MIITIRKSAPKLEVENEDELSNCFFVTDEDFSPIMDVIFNNCDFNNGIFTYMPEEGDPLNNEHCENLRREYDGDMDDGENVF